MKRNPQLLTCVMVFLYLCLHLSACSSANTNNPINESGTANLFSESSLKNTDNTSPPDNDNDNTSSYSDSTSESIDNASELNVTLESTSSIETPIQASEGLDYKLNAEGTGYTVVGLGSCLDKNVIIPETFNDLPVTGIKGFGYSSFLKSVVLTDNIEWIGYEAFAWSSIQSITFGKGIKSIDENAFINCNSLSEVNIPDIGIWCEIEFYSERSNPILYSGHIYDNLGTRITELVIPEGTTKISNYAFCGGTFKQLTIPNTVSHIGKSAFDFCQQIESVTIDSNSIDIEEYAFRGCTKLDYISIGNPQKATTNSHIAFNGADIFFNCTNIRSIRLNAEKIYITKISSLGYYDGITENQVEIYYIGTKQIWVSMLNEYNISEDMYGLAFGHQTTIHCSDGDIVVS